MVCLLENNKSICEKVILSSSCGEERIPPIPFPSPSRPGEVQEDVQGVLQRGDGGGGGLRHYKQLHLGGRLRVEAGPGQQSLSRQRTSGPRRPAGQQMWHTGKGRGRGVLSGPLLWRQLLRGLVGVLCKGVCWVSVPRRSAEWAVRDVSHLSQLLLAWMWWEGPTVPSFYSLFNHDGI